MDQPMAGVLGTALAVCAAAAFGGSSVLQYRAGRKVPPERVGRPRLLLHLLREPAWRWSVLLALVAFGLQVAALELLPLIFVQPVLVTGLLWYIALAALAAHRRPDRLVVAGAALCIAGLSGFLLLARPTAGAGQGLDSPASAVTLLAAVTVAVGACVAAARFVSPQWRPLPPALAAGICYGTTAGLLSSATATFPQGFLATMGRWEPYAITVLGPSGVLFSQNAFQAGPVGALALATMTAMDPLVSIAIGLVWLDERIGATPWAIAGEIAALAVLTGAIVLLAHHAPHVRAAPPRDRPPD
ncbi:DMT family transporter [Dactylosporangium sp. CA-092794]|uniref:DMT family transporter n=1 Tax=Dactylosporangium sp. CA-092794 TaxID=3239929 RepID=UPI003D8B9D12